MSKDNSFEKLSNVREVEGWERDRKERYRGQRQGERGAKHQVMVFLRLERLMCVIKGQDTMKNER